MTLHAALSLIAPGEACVFSLRVMKHADGRMEKPRLVVSTDGRTIAGHSLAGLVEIATRDRDQVEADEVLRELETVQG